MAKVKKTKKNSTTIAEKTKAKEYFDYLKLNYMRKIPMSQEALKRLANALRKTVVENEDMISVNKFFLYQGICDYTMRSWIKKSRELKEAVEFAREVIACRRDEGAATRKYDGHYIAKSMPIFDKKWKDLEEWRAKLRADDKEKTPTTFNINIPSFSDKKEKNNVGRKGTKAS